MTDITIFSRTLMEHVLRIEDVLLLSSDVGMEMNL